MPLLLILLAVSIFLYLWLARRGTSLTRACRWRAERRLGPTVWRCAACGAVFDPGPGVEPSACLRPPGRV